MSTQVLILQPWDNELKSKAFLALHPHKSTRIDVAYEMAVSEIDVHTPTEHIPDVAVSKMREDGWQMIPMGNPTIVRY